MAFLVKISSGNNTLYPFSFSEIESIPFFGFQVCDACVSFFSSSTPDYITPDNQRILNGVDFNKVGCISKLIIFFSINKLKIKK